MIENGAVKGIEVARQPRILPNELFEDELIEADIVISTLPVWNVLNVVPEWELPDWYVAQIRHLAQDHFRVAWLGLYLAVDEPVAVIDRKELSTWLHTPKGRLPGFLFEQTAMDPSSAPEGKYLYVMGGVIPGARGTDERYLREAFATFEEDIGVMYPGLAKPSWRRRHLVYDPSFGVIQKPGLVGVYRPHWRAPNVDGLYFAERDLPQPRDRRRPRRPGRADRRRGHPRPAASPDSRRPGGTEMARYDVAVIGAGPPASAPQPCSRRRARRSSCSSAARSSAAAGWRRTTRATSSTSAATCWRTPARASPRSWPTSARSSSTASSTRRCRSGTTASRWGSIRDRYCGNKDELKKVIKALTGDPLRGAGPLGRPAHARVAHQYTHDQGTIDLFEFITVLECMTEDWYDHSASDNLYVRKMHFEEKHTAAYSFWPEGGWDKIFVDLRDAIDEHGGEVRLGTS